MIRTRWWGLCLSLILSSCTTVGTVENRSEEINKASTSYTNTGILYNILRSREAEPINFVTLTAFTGHATSSIGIGLPTIVVGAGRTSAQNLFLFGPNSVGASESTDFNISVLDDPQSIAALSRPVDPATLGFWISQQFNRDVVFFLMISQISVIHPDGKVQTYLNEPLTINSGDTSFNFDNTTFGPFFNLLAQYIRRGLTVAVDQNYVPQPNKAGRAKFCFDSALPDPTRDEPQDVSVLHTTTCPSPSELNAAPVDSSDNVARIEITGTSKPSIKTSSTQKSEAPDWTFIDPSSESKVQIYTRSVFGMFRYLGEYARLIDAGSLYRIKDYKDGLFTGSEQSRLLALNQNIVGCWTSVFYEGSPWCVPRAAVTTKRVFDLLHRLFRLYASPSNQTVTPTVRLTQ